MAKMKLHGNEYNLLKTLDVDLPTLKTAWSDLPEWMRLNVMHKLDISKKWCGCWMWKGATNHNGEPKISFRDNYTRKHGRIGRLQTLTVKREIARLFIDATKLPRRTYSGEYIAEPDFDVIHLCENKSCLNPAHLLVSVTDAKQRDNEALRDKYLAPGTYYVG